MRDEGRLDAGLDQDDGLRSLVLAGHGTLSATTVPAALPHFTERWRDWRRQYQHNYQSSGTWESECVFVPRAVVFEELQAWMSGTVRPNVKR